jgi:hypothetical protein
LMCMMILTNREIEFGVKFCTIECKVDTSLRMRTVL